MVHPPPAFLRGPPSLGDSAPRCSPSPGSPLVRSTGRESSVSDPSRPRSRAGNLGDRRSFDRGGGGGVRSLDRHRVADRFSANAKHRCHASPPLWPRRKSCDSRDSARIRVVMGTHSHADPGCPPGWHHADQSAALLILLHPVMSYLGDQESCQRLGGVVPARWEVLENRSK